MRPKSRELRAAPVLSRLKSLTRSWTSETSKHNLWCSWKKNVELPFPLKPSSLKSSWKLRMPWKSLKKHSRQLLMPKCKGESHKWRRKEWGLSRRKWWKRRQMSQGSWRAMNSTSLRCTTTVIWLAWRINCRKWRWKDFRRLWITCRINRELQVSRSIVWSPLMNLKTDWIYLKSTNAYGMMWIVNQKKLKNSRERLKVKDISNG